MRLHMRGAGIDRRTFVSISVASLIGPIVGAGTFSRGSPGSVSRSNPGDARELVSVKDFGVLGDGRADDTAALQRAINALAATGGDLDFGEGTILVSAEIDGRGLSGNKLSGRATIKAASGTDFMYLLNISGTAGVTVEGLTFDANKAGRGRTAVGRLACLLANKTTNNVIDGVTFQNTLGVAGPVSSVAVSASDGVVGLFARNLRFLNLGIDANNKPSDGLFVRGDHCLILDTYGENVTDHIVVMEGCNYSTVRNTVGNNCTSFVAISNDTDSDVFGNTIDGVYGSCNYFGSFGAIVGAYTYGAGWIRGCDITRVSVRGAPGARGGGPAVFFSGKVEGRADDITVDPGASAGVMHHAVLVDIEGGGGGVIITNSDLTADRKGTCIRILGSSDNIRINNNRLSNGTYGVFGDGVSRFTESENTFSGQTTSRVGFGGRASRG